MDEAMEQYLKDKFYKIESDNNFVLDRQLAWSIFIEGFKAGLRYSGKILDVILEKSK